MLCVKKKKKIVDNKNFFSIPRILRAVPDAHKLGYKQYLSIANLS